MKELFYKTDPEAAPSNTDVSALFYGEKPEEAPKDAPKFHSETDAVYTHFGLAEGTKAHVGADKQNLTMARGIVPDSVMFDGQEIAAGKNTLTDKYLQKNMDKLDYTTAMKKVGGKVFKGADYDSEEMWGKAVLNEYVDMVKKEYPSLKDGNAVSSLVSFMWNTSASTGTLGWSGTRNTVSELLKAPNKRNPQKLFDIAKHSFVNGEPSIGLLKRRVADLNIAIDNEIEGNFVTMAKAEDGSTDMMVFDSAQNMLWKSNSKKPFPYNKTKTIDVFQDREVAPMTASKPEQSPEGQVVGRKLESGLYEDDQSGKQYLVRPDGSVEELG